MGIDSQKTQNMFLLPSVSSLGNVVCDCIFVCGIVLAVPGLACPFLYYIGISERWGIFFEFVSLVK